MIFLVLGFVIWLYSIKHLQKSFLWFLVYKVFLVTNINLLSLPGIPILSLDMSLTLWFFFWIFKRRKTMNLCSRKMPYTRPMIFLFFSYFISTIFAIAGFGSAFSAYLKDIVNFFLTPWMIWKIVDTEEDFAFVIKRLVIAFMITCIYGLVESVIQENPLVAYETTLVTDTTRTVDFRYEIDEFRGYRVQSVFEHPIGAGINWAMFAMLMCFIMLQNNKKYFVSQRKKYLATMLLCFFCMLLSNCRGPILFVLIAFVGLIDFKNKKFYYMAVCGLVIGAFLCAIMPENYLNIILSIFNPEYQNKVGGSNAEMRFEQMAAALTIVESSPVLGLGYKFSYALNNAYTRALLGLESMWLRIIVQFGMLGVLANIYWAFYSLRVIPKRYKERRIFWFSLAYWVTASLTSVPGMLHYLYYFIIFYFIKQKKFACEYKR